jgi:hypothetical protein
MHEHGEHDGEPGARPGQDDAFEAFDAFGVRGGASTGGRGALVPYEKRPPAQRGGADASAYEGLRPVDPSAYDSGTAPTEAVRPAREPLELMAVTRTPSGGSARVRRVVAGGYLLTINPIDGTDVAVCPPAERPAPVRRTPEERAAHIAAGRPSPPPGPPAPELPLLEREEERDRLIRLLTRGRSVRVVGPSGAGRTALLESAAKACAELAPDGVLWLSGYRRTLGDLLQALYATVYAGDDHRPGRAELPELLREVGAVVVVDDLELGGAALAELLGAAPECAFLLSATPEVPPPAADSAVEDLYLSGLSRTASVDLLALAAGRALEDDETAWAADLWFESEGLPLRFVQAGALLRQRDALRQPPEPDADDSVWENGQPAAPLPDLTGFDDPSAPAFAPVAPPARPAPVAVPLPSLAESAAPADLLASRLSEAGREALAFAVALDGEIPHASHLPALVGDTHGDAALGEMTAVGLAVPVATHYRLAAGVARQLTGPLTAEGELSEVQAHTAALHYAWWTGHPSVTAARAAAESEAIIAALAACRDNGNPGAAVLLARSVASSFAAALHWGAWERALRIGQEAARLTGEVAEEAYFHHELGVLALCNGTYDRARAELEASIAMRGVLADRQGTAVGRRALALVQEAEPTPPPALELPPVPPPALTDTSALEQAPEPPVVIQPSGGTRPGPKRLALVGTRRNLVAAGTGVLLAAVLGTIVTLGATSGGDPAPKNQGNPVETSTPDMPPPPSPATTEPPSTSAPASPSTTPATTPPTTTPPPSSATSTPTRERTTPPPSTSSSPPHRTTSGGSSSGSSGGKTTSGASGGSTSGSTTGTSTTGSTTGTTTGTTDTGGTSTGTTTNGGTSAGTEGGTTTGTSGETTTTGGTTTGTTGETTDGGATGG